MKKIGYRLLREENGNVSLIVAGGMVVFLLFLALVADVGMLYVRQQKLQNALDAGVLAGIQKIIYSKAEAEETARFYVQSNGAGSFGVEADPAKLTISADGEETVSLSFAKIMGVNASHVRADAKARAGTTVAMTGLVPIGVPDQTFKYGQLYELSEEAGEGYSGNYGFLDLGGGGASALTNNIRYGYEGEIEVGDKIPTKTGINHGPVKGAIQFRMDQDIDRSECQSYQTADRSCHRIMFLPVIDSLDVNGKKPVTVLGFAAFFLEGTEGSGGDMIITGRFLRMVTPGELGSGKNYGVYSVKLTE
ncbi:pilus assembly protein TadG-related protein [Brevibacillus sp. H7]|uniref:pilus assembly protein TadG-related protein n=1 Tax=Brevibacillus sp. H7 TaxID=3349138 RepID=UPI0038216E51